MAVNTHETPTTGSRIRVLLVAGHALFRQAVRASLEDAPDIEVIGEAADIEDAPPVADQLQPDVTLIDAAGSDGAALTTLRLRRRSPSTRVVVLGDEDPDLLVDVVEVGAVGYLTQESALSDLIETTRSVHEGRMRIPPSMLGSLVTGLLERRRQAHEALDRLSRLTQREREVLELLASGSNNQGIAQALSISPETARTHVQNLLSKLGVHSRLEAAAFLLHVRSLGVPTTLDEELTAG